MCWVWAFLAFSINAAGDLYFLAAYLLGGRLQVVASTYLSGHIELTEFPL